LGGWAAAKPEPKKKKKVAVRMPSLISEKEKVEKRQRGESASGFTAEALDRNQSKRRGKI